VESPKTLFSDSLVSQLSNQTMTPQLTLSPPLLATAPTLIVVTAAAADADVVSIIDDNSS
jgi:hypothetical protein